VGNELKVLVLAGGVSEEREVSLASAKAITESLQRLGHTVSVIDAASGKSLLDRSGKYLLEEDTASSSKIALKQGDNLALTESIRSPDYKDTELVYVALHGGAGEDGTIQALLDLAGMIYTGSGRLASAVSMNKDFAKRILRNEGIPTPDWVLVKLQHAGDFKNQIGNLRQEFGFPLIVKPNNSGSTVGLTLVKGEGDLETAFKKAFEVSREILVEKYIRGREITGAVLDGQALPLVEIIPTNELYDYQCKYTKGKSQYICPAEMPAAVAEEMRQLASRVYQIIGCSGLARVDFILGEGNQPYFLEVNTLPGMTELSLAPMAAKEAGISFDELIDRICRSALKK
jgi:D-alanine-D-alanine ligase